MFKISLQMEGQMHIGKNIIFVASIVLPALPTEWAWQQPFFRHCRRSPIRLCDSFNKNADGGRSLHLCKAVRHSTQFNLLREASIVLNRAKKLFMNSCVKLSSKTFSRVIYMASEDVRVTITCSDVVRLSTIYAFGVCLYCHSSWVCRWSSGAHFWCWEWLERRCSCSVGMKQMFWAAVKGKKLFGTFYYLSTSGANGIFAHYCANMFWLTDWQRQVCLNCYNWVSNFVDCVGHFYQLWPILCFQDNTRREEYHCLNSGLQSFHKVELCNQVLHLYY